MAQVRSRFLLVAQNMRERVHKPLKSLVMACGGCLLMASLAAAIGLLPASIATGIGSETQKPLARVVVGGMITAPVLLLLVLPALYILVHRHSQVRALSRRIVAQEERASLVGGD